MELLSNLLSRAIYFLELDALDPFGKQSASESTITIKDKYSFSIVPQSLGQVTIEKGAEFLSGRMGNIAIDKLVLYPNGIMVDTRSSTDDSEKVAQDFVDVSRALMGSKVRVERKHLVSQITFRSQMKLNKINPVLNEITKQIENSLSESLKQGFIAETTSIVVAVDITQVNIQPAKFTIERRAGTPFFENIYFSSAPLKTSLHLELVEKFENSIL